MAEQYWAEWENHQKPSGAESASTRDNWRAYAHSQRMKKIAEAAEASTSSESNHLNDTEPLQNLPRVSSEHAEISAISLVELSTIETQTELNEESARFKKLHGLVSRYIRQCSFEELRAARENLTRERGRDRADRSDRWRLFQRGLLAKDWRENLNNSADGFQNARSSWKRLQQLAVRNEQLSQLESARQERAQTSQRARDDWRRFGQILRSRTIASGCRSAMERTDDHKSQTAAEFSANFLMDQLSGLDDFTRQNVKNGFENFDRTIPRSFWRDVDLFSYRFTKESMNSSIRTALPKLTSEASELATAFAQCQSLLLALQPNGRGWHSVVVKQETPHKDLHVIVNFAPDDEISLLDQSADW
jgi:hypothetical protein